MAFETIPRPQKWFPIEISMVPPRGMVTGENTTDGQVCQLVTSPHCEQSNTRRLDHISAPGVTPSASHPREVIHFFFWQIISFFGYSSLQRSLLTAIFSSLGYTGFRWRPQRSSLAAYLLFLGGQKQAWA